mmetsp:Transcript_23570/g.51048  ORF Transcript_23570/g.51048 Transcript_23570/m.51048 type:complete len:317 (+) Transcript_23570:108-1058(+)
MSASVDADEVCAACGKQANDGVTLKRCNACKIVTYCGVDCQKAHRKQHKNACKKRAVELKDEILFKQPEEHYRGDCPICYLPHPLEASQVTFKSCCGKDICKGCQFAQVSSSNLPRVCAFCRVPNPTSKFEFVRRARERMEAGDLRAIHELGCNYYSGGAGLVLDLGEAFKMFTKAAELGDIASHYQLGVMYWNAQHVDKDLKRAVHHFEIAAIGGHPDGRFNLAVDEIDNNNRNIERAMKHFFIASLLDQDSALEQLKRGYKNGHVSKEHFLSAFRAHHDAVGSRKSKQRDEAASGIRYKVCTTKYGYSPSKSSK